MVKMAKEQTKRPNEQWKYRKVPVECVETGEVYEGIVDACKALPCSYNAMCVALRKGGRCRGYHWKYVGKDAVIKPERPTDWKGKPIIDIDTKEEWVSVPSCARALGTSVSVISSAISRYYTVNGRKLCRKYDYEANGDSLFEKYKDVKPKNILNRNRAVRCVETNELFKNSTECAYKLNCSRQAISAAIRDGFAIKGHHYIMDGDEFVEHEFTSSMGRRSFSIIDPDSKMVWKSVKKCAEYFSLKTEQVRYCINHNKPLPNGVKVIYAKDLINL